MSHDVGAFPFLMLIHIQRNVANPQKGSNRVPDPRTSCSHAGEFGLM